MTTRSHHHHRIIAVGVAAAASLVVAGCSSSANGTTTTNSAAARPPSAGRAALPASLTDQGRLCAAVKQADAQALMLAKVTAGQTGGPESCAFVRAGEPINGDNLTMTFFPADADKKYYRSFATGPLAGNTKTTALSGVGDEAYWFQVVPQAAPVLVARRNSLTCVVQPPADLTTVRIGKTGSPPIYTVPAAATTAFAQGLGRLCTDAFSASG